MEVTSISPLRVGSLVWQSSEGRFVLTVVCKATYTLTPEVSPLAAEQEGINERDNHWDDDPRRSVDAPGDLAPFKPRADVLLVGSIYPQGERGVSLMRFRFGPIERRIDQSMNPIRTSAANSGKLAEGVGFEPTVEFLVVCRAALPE